MSNETRLYFLTRRTPALSAVKFFFVAIRQASLPAAPSPSIPSAKKCGLGGAGVPAGVLIQGQRHYQEASTLCLLSLDCEVECCLSDAGTEAGATRLPIFHTHFYGIIKNRMSGLCTVTEGKNNRCNRWMCDELDRVPAPLNPLFPRAQSTCHMSSSRCPVAETAWFGAGADSQFSPATSPAGSSASQHCAKAGSAGNA